MPHDSGFPESRRSRSSRDPDRSRAPRGGRSEGERGREGERVAESDVVRRTIEATGQRGGSASSGESTGGTHRVAQVGALIARVLRERIARGLNDPRVQGMVSILGVECTADFATAHVRVSVLPADRARLTLSGLRSATRHLEGVVRKATRLRRVPSLQFEIDDSIKREAALTESLHAAGMGTGDDSTDTNPTTEPAATPPTTVEPQDSSS
jgi:ribosome-binding factor A